jgi:hypothetical protein
MAKGRNLDYPVPLQGGMAKNYLGQMEQDARRLRRALRDEDALPGWVSAYIFTSADRLQTASRYMDQRIEAFQPSEYSGPTTDTLEKIVNNPLLIAGGLALNLVLFGTAGAVIGALLPVATAKQGWAVGSVAAIGWSAMGQYRTRKALAAARAAGH